MTSREELKRKVDSKSALGDYLSQVFDIASFAIDNASVVFSLVKNLCEQDPISGRDSQDLALLLHKLAKPSPRVRMKSMFSMGKRFTYVLFVFLRQVFFICVGSCQ